MAIAYFSTWTTYGTWLPGDARGWYCRQAGFMDPDSEEKSLAQRTMAETPLILDAAQRKIVEEVIEEHCQVRKWMLHAVNCRSNHVHVAVTAVNVPLERPREQFKMWATRRLKETCPGRMHWWTRRGWDLFVDDERQLSEIVRYIVEGQD